MPRRHQCRWSISDRNYIFNPPFPDIQFNFGSFVNKIMLKIKDHWIINIVDYIPEIIRSLDWRIISLYRKSSGNAFLNSVSIHDFDNMLGQDTITCYMSGMSTRPTIGIYMYDPPLSFTLLITVILSIKNSATKHMFLSIFSDNIC
jgi:hypothetical protein